MEINDGHRQEAERLAAALAMMPVPQRPASDYFGATAGVIGPVQQHTTPLAPPAPQPDEPVA